MSAPTAVLWLTITCVASAYIIVHLFYECQFYLVSVNCLWFLRREIFLFSDSGKLFQSDLKCKDLPGP